MSQIFKMCYFACVVFIVVEFASIRLVADDKVDFAREILPILSNTCFVCHGPDTRDSDLLRLDSYESAISDLGGYKAIDPQDLVESEMIIRINSDDDPMPPKNAQKKLTNEQRELLTRWIRQGGKYQKHWAFVPPKKAKPKTREYEQSFIDAFVAEQLDKNKLDFAPQAEKATLARRVALTLTGLPPEPEQLESFLADVSDEAYEKLVDRLLDSPKFGEHQARFWLDAVRYGDTHGLHLDNRRGIFPYRDWVVRAFNNNLPLDQFIIWQIAGDLLPGPTLEQLVATGFVRMNPSTAEGGAIPEEFQAKNNFDRTENVGTVFLGMSLTCARCHTHKYDPIPQTEYYRLLAYFNSTSEPAMDGNSYTYGPVVRAPNNQEAWDAWDGIVSQQNKLLVDSQKLFDDNKTATLKYASNSLNWKSENWRISEVVNSDKPAPDDSAWKPATEFPGKSTEKLPKPNQSIWIDFQVSTPAQQTVWLMISSQSTSKVWVDDQESGGSMPLPIVVTSGTRQIRIKMDGVEPSAIFSIDLFNPWESAAKNNSWKDCSVEDRLLMLSDSQSPLASGSSLKSAIDLRIRKASIEADFVTSLVAKDLPKPRETRLLNRGEYDLPIGEPLQPGVFSVMGPLPENAPGNRLGLAQWLTSKDHPLVSRVLVNRIWQRTFGEGLVRTPEDFGLQGQQPTHPELLDWLAVELIENGWDMKHLLRLMVTSRTFRQESNRRSDVDDPENRLFARGPRYRLDAEVLRDLGLWASELLVPEMGGEGVKPYQPDGMWLAMAHPGSNTKNYVRDQGEKLFRRSLYVYWKRTSPHPMMTLFDAPSRESSCVRRSRTNTASQSLGLLNETQRIEMSRVLAEKLIFKHPDDEARLNELFMLVSCRHPDARQRDVCNQLLHTLSKRYANSEADALSLINTGELPRNESLNPAELAAWTQLVVTVLASDIAILLY